MLPTDLIFLVEHVRPPRLDLRNAEIETISANSDSLRVTLPYSASDTTDSTEGVVVEKGVEQEVRATSKTSAYQGTVCVVRYVSENCSNLDFVKIPHPRWGLAQARIDLKPGVVFFA